MNIKKRKNNFIRRARIFAVLFAAIFLVPVLRAQPTEQAVPSRFLFVFDTSWDMKYRVDGVQKALNTMLATSLNGQLHAGDSLGVWTFNQNLRPGDYPLQSWDPDRAVLIASNLVRFVGGQHYAKKTRFEVLQPSLNEVVQSSERLTVLVFCDGETKASGTPFDAGINQFFQQKSGDQKSAHQPFVIVLRSQLGKYVSCAMGLPPQPVTFPEFPPLPVPPPPLPPKVTNSPPRVLTSAVPPLIIVGTKIESSPSLPQMESANSPPKTKPAPPPIAPPVVPVVSNTTPAAPAVPTNAAVAPPTNQVATKIIAPATASPPVPAPDNSGFGNRKNLIIGAGSLGAVILLGMIVRSRLRRKDSSLITRSMTDRR